MSSDKPATCSSPKACPCGTGRAYADCCGRWRRRSSG
ncbi:SEC-C metal-binding domain-containing protein, partial [Caldimonas sp.]